LPSRLSPADQLNGWIYSPHQLGKNQGFFGCRLTIDRITPIGGFIADLPESDIICFYMTMSDSKPIGGIITVIHPLGSL
jgi:hypothetical protein